ncbi:hypothetical protein DEU56DRAFT_106735 [Suillus clintonianus]|uniref:uncharacterized protein n=1 Tax=Suillus clintonianus TaxID=1904413 RepID=UPI001B872398|nr:uncharacterized protein DEU56DRAFT_106735 [Suillus clintonianus]KAG2148046.1 hypothetical protein DEU56DRAFT_106735 [Suillus clintonianus]
MDPTFDVSAKVQESNMAAKQRFESFKMGGGAPANSLNNYIPKHSHGRSRSRNSSISSLSTLSISASAPSFPSPVDFTFNNVPSIPPPSKRPNSHHRRRSSVSTRRESAELMGVSLPDLPAANSDDNVNLGDKDSIRRRALWALEGKPDLAFSKVEIPDITSPNLTKSFEFPTKPSFPPGTGISGHGISNLMSKRDSFGKMFASTSTSKDQLQTLVEEEEEEEEESQEDCPAPVAEVVEEFTEASAIPPTPAPTPVAKSAIRHRPASLNLRPLSLVSGNAVGCAPGNLPTPTLTPNPRPNGLRSLALTSGSDTFSLTNPNPTNRSMNRHSTTVTPSSSGSFSLASRRSASTESSSSSDISRKRSSISYKRSVASIPRDMGVLPTPGSTPTDRRFSESSDVGCVAEQPLTAAEQHFLFRSHNVLLARIMDLERTLRTRSMSRSRPLSAASDVSATSSEPSDEMLQLISDLKAERDELKRDVDGWRMRVADADKQASVLARRVDSERREAWVARSRLGLLEVEKRGLDNALGSKNAELQQSISQSEQLKKECDSMRGELDRLRARLRDADSAVDECIRLRAALELERTRRAELEKLLDDAGLLNTPTIPLSVDGQVQCSVPSRSYGTRSRGLGFQSIDSDSSSTDVESVDQSFTKAEFTLDAVTEEDEDEDEDTCDFSDDEDGMAGYEDAEDSDLSFQSPDGSSIGSEDELDIMPVSVLNEATNRLNSLSKPAQPKSLHSPRASLSKTWTFPRGQPVIAVKRDVDEIDRFFGCLDDDENSPPLSSEEMSKVIFTSTFGLSYDDEDELPPFVIPSDVGTVVLDLPTSNSLDVVPEEDEEDAGKADNEHDGEPLGEEVEGGIRFTFDPPPAVYSPPPIICITPPTESEAAIALKPTPVYEPFDDEEDDVSPFTFPQSRFQEPITPPSSSPPTSESSSRPSSRTTNSPSSIPRATSLRSFMPLTPPSSATQPGRASDRFTALADYPATSFTTPPSRRGGTTFIPQPVSPSPSKIFSPMTSRVPVPVLRSKGATNANDATLRCYGASEEVTGANSDTCEYSDQQASTSSLSSIMSSPLAARFSFQTLSNFIPLSWTPGAAAVASRTTPSTSVSSIDDVAQAASSFTSASHGVRRSIERRFVSRDQQLEKLKNRLGNNHINGIGRCLAVAPCGACKGADVFL